MACGGDEGESDDAGTTQNTPVNGTGGSGGTATGDGTAIDPARADQVAHAAMLKPEDLPGSGWTVVNTDQFDDSPIDVGAGSTATDTCKQINDKVNSVQREVEASRAGRASTEFQRQSGPLPIPVSLQNTVVVYRDQDAAEKSIDSFRDALSGDDFTKCLNEALKEGMGGTTDAKVSVQSADAAASAPEDGVAKAYDVDISVMGQSFTFRFELYAWRYQNATATSFVFGTKDQLPAEVPTTAVNKTQDQLEAAAS